MDFALAAGIGPPPGRQLLGQAADAGFGVILPAGFREGHQPGAAGGPGLAAGRQPALPDVAADDLLGDIQPPGGFLDGYFLQNFLRERGRPELGAG